MRKEGTGNNLKSCGNVEILVRIVKIIRSLTIVKIKNQEYESIKLSRPSILVPNIKYQKVPNTKQEVPSIKYLDKGLVELKAGGGESIKVGCVHWGGGYKGEIHLKHCRPLVVRLFLKTLLPTIPHKDGFSPKKYTANCFNRKIIISQWHVFV